MTPAPLGRRLPLPEFVALTALLFSLIAYGTDAMLPALEQIADGLDAPSVTRVQLIVAAFIFGTGVGQLVSGPLSDAVGRKPVLLGGIAIFMVASLWAAVTNSLEWLLAARFVQGLGISAPRTVGMAMVRDLYAGRMMARVVSLAMMCFVLVPAIAPLAGQGIMLAFGWRAIFLSFLVLGGVAGLWLWLRQGETHPPEARRPLRLSSIAAAAKEVATNRRTATCIVVLAFIYSIIFAYLSSAQQVYVDWLDTGTRFPLYFALIALFSGSASAINAILVVRLGMWRLASFGMALTAVGSLGFGLLIVSGMAEGQELLVFISWSVMVFFVAGLVFANMNALAMEPMGHIAGVASALVGSISTMGSVLIAVPIGQMYNGTGVPLIFGVAICAAIGFVLNLTTPRSV